MNCALTAQGQAYCWGNNLDRLIKPGSVPADAYVFTPEVVQPSLSFARLSIYRQAACGVLADRTDVYCWGANYYGQQGRGILPTWRPTVGGLDNEFFPTAAPIITPPGSNPAVKYKDVDIGFRHACALKDDGAAYCWGENANGQLGTGTAVLNDSGSAVAQAVVDGSGTALRFDSISAGVYMTCGMVSGSGTRCWGSNFQGSLGNGTWQDSPTPLPVVNLP
ncbi:RCC1 domain-containing protein [Deinococcus malanensis]|uniref:RCC1 domain-containing protein n=1 Tax=Deinococcus malanensis TaxID=1706855 RepID=UPI003635C811